MAEKKFDLSSIMAEYGDNDFGFTAIDEDEDKASASQTKETKDKCCKGACDRC